MRRLAEKSNAYVRQNGVPARVRRIVRTVAIALSLLALPVSSGAWEFDIESAQLNFRYIYASQAGAQGFFGPYDTDLSSKGGDFAPLNGWFQRKLVSGTTAVASSTRLAIFPVLKLNKAVSIRGTYRIGPDTTTIADLLASSGAELAGTPGRWTRLWMTADTPLGKIYYGKRGFQQACGLQFGSAETAYDIFESDRRAVEIFQLETFYGPMTFGAGFYPWRLGSGKYWNIEDQNAARTTHVLGYIRYAAGDMDAGAGGFYWNFEEGPEAAKTTEERIAFPPSTTSATEGWLYLKYTNGRLFANAEADWYYRTIRHQSSQDGTFSGTTAAPYPGGGSRFAPKYVESWRYMVEFGGFSGPLKLNFLLAHMPGPDRRHGILIDKQPYIQELERSGYQVFYPYCILMAKYFRAGVNSYRDMSASNVAAAQINYMVASNMDLLVSGLYAARSSYGYGWGYVRPNPEEDHFGELEFKESGNFASPAPSIPAQDLGWEINVGMVWKLLENWQLTMRGAYWQPGRWFNYACVDKSAPSWNDPSEANNFGINPSRTIDPVWGLELYLNTRL